MSYQQEKVTASSNNSTPQMIGPFPIDSVQFRDCIEGMRQIPDQSVDLAISDPPYNASKGNVWKWDNSVKLPGFGGNWSKIMVEWDDMPLTDYFAFTIAWLKEIKRIVRPTGSIWVHGTFHNIGIINFVMQLLQIEIINEVIWYKRNSFPNLSRRRLTASHETILWAHTGGKKRRYFFNYEVAKTLGYKEDILKEPNKQLRTIWDIPNNKKPRELIYGKHPAQKPLRLLKRMLQISAKPGDLIIVPFTGTGSECVAAKELGIHFIGFENNSTYFKICQQRLTHANLDLFHQPLSPFRLTSNSSQLIPPMKQSRAKTVPPLIKWTGSKRLQALKIIQYVPKHRRYFEPFLGGGSLLYLVARPGSVGGDIYEPLIKLWKAIQIEPQSAVDNYTKQWNSLQKDFPGYYYKVRNRFNRNPNPFDLNFLIRTCVNGIIRFNHNGEFNNSFHLSRKGMQPERFAKTVKAWHKMIQDVIFVCQDYEETVSEAKEGDFVYFDPPYAGNNMRYISDLDLSKFFSQLEKLNQRKVNWMLSFDGCRGNIELFYPVPNELYKRRLLIPSSNSAAEKVLNGPIEQVCESLYLNY